MQHSNAAAFLLNSLLEVVIGLYRLPVYAQQGQLHFAGASMFCKLLLSLEHICQVALYRVILLPTIMEVDSPFRSTGLSLQTLRSTSMFFARSEWGWAFQAPRKPGGLRHHQYEDKYFLVERGTCLAAARIGWHYLDGLLGSLMSSEAFPSNPLIATDSKNLPCMD